jgi:hypothetical protein
MFLSLLSCGCTVFRCGADPSLENMMFPDYWMLELRVWDPVGTGSRVSGCVRGTSRRWDGYLSSVSGQNLPWLPVWSGRGAGRYLDGLGLRLLVPRALCAARGGCGEGGWGRGTAVVFLINTSPREP